MSCNHCSTKFNFFHKEMGCANCGLSFCNKCLKQKAKVPTKGQSELHVCRNCFQKLNKSDTTCDSNNIVIPPDAFIKRLEAMENPAAPPITVYKQDPKIQSLRNGLSATDQKLVDRLEKLKDKPKGPPPTESELRLRLANLKGENNYVEAPKKQINATDQRTDQEKADSLLEQFLHEQDIEFNHNPQEDIEVRLATLREQGVKPNEGPYIKNLHDSSGSEEEVDKITKKIMDEVALDEKSLPVSVTSSSQHGGKPFNEEAEFQPDELPWCVLCNNDASVRCLDCSGDLYCERCNREAHAEWAETDHKVVPYKQR